MKDKILTHLIGVIFSAMLVTTASQAQAAGNSTVRVGAARVDISGPDYRDRPLTRQYAHERLYLRAIVVDNGDSSAVLIGADLGGINEDVWADAANRISGSLDIPVANIVISSTHTHSDTPASTTPARGTPRYGSAFVADVAVQAVSEAVSKLEPAQIGFARGEAHLNVNRDAISHVTHLWTQAANLDAPSDKTVAIVSFVRPNGEPIAAYVNYAMHPVGGYLAGFRSADFAGATSRYVEQAFGDDMVVVFTQGASGDQNPRWLRTGTNVMASRGGAEITGWEMVREDIEAPLREGDVTARTAKPAVADQLADYQQALGIILGEEVIRAMTYTDYSAANVAIWGRQSMLSCPGRRRLDSGREGMAGEYEDGEDASLRLGVLVIGDIAIATGAAEIYTQIGQRVVSESPMSKTMFVTLANGRGNTGYIPDDESFGHRTFQVLGTRLKPGCAEDGIVDTIAELAGDYMAQ